MSAWDFPVVIVGAVALAIAVFVWLLRAAAPGRAKIGFECDVCGRRQHGIYAREWRFCPYCGAPKPQPPRF